MSILIKDMKMPTERESFNLTIKYNGTVIDTETGIQVAEAYELPPHGRLIDADKLRCLYDPHDYGLDGEQADEYDRYHVSLPVIRQNIDDMPTIIEAEGNNDDWLFADLDTIIDCYSEPKEAEEEEI